MQYCDMFGLLYGLCVGFFLFLKSAKLSFKMSLDFISHCIRMFLRVLTAVINGDTAQQA